MTFFIALILSSTIDYLVAVVSLFILQRISGGRPGLMTIAPAFVITGIVFAAKTICLLYMGVNLLGVINLIYIDLVVVMPLVALTVLIAAHWSSYTLRTAARIPAILVVVAAPLTGIYASYVEPYRLQLETAEIDLAGQRAGSRPVTIGVLADVQTDRVTGHEHRAVDILMRRQPDVIVLPGDIFQGDPSQFEK